MVSGRWPMNTTLSSGELNRLTGRCPQFCTFENADHTCIRCGLPPRPPVVVVRYFAPDGTVVEVQEPGRLVALKGKKGEGK